MANTLCPECSKEITLGSNPEIGQRILCQRCQTQLEVIWLYPLSLERLEAQKNPVTPDPHKQKKKNNE